MVKAACWGFMEFRALLLVCYVNCFFIYFLPINISFCNRFSYEVRRQKIWMQFSDLIPKTLFAIVINACRKDCKINSKTRKHMFVLQLKIKKHLKNINGILCQINGLNEFITNVFNQTWPCTWTYKNRIKKRFAV